MAAGPIKFATFFNIMKDDIVVKEVMGNMLYLALENSVSLYPSASGRYFQIARI